MITVVTGASEDAELANLKSGRRLDDSVFEADDQNKYEGSLMKLTARPQVITTNPPASITDDVEMGDVSQIIIRHQYMYTTEIRF